MESIDRPPGGKSAPAKAKADRPGRTRSDAKREKIVRSAAKLFLERGYDSVSINDIIEVVGGSKGTIYSNFAGKEKLFEAVVQQMCDDVTIRIDTRPDGTIEQQLTRMATSFVAKVLTPPTMAFHRLMTSIGRTFPEAGRLFYRTGPQTVYRIFADWIRLQQELGKLGSDEDPMVLAVLLHDMLIGEHILSWLTSAANDKERARRIDQTVRLSVRVFLRGCATSKGAGGARSSR